MNHQATHLVANGVTVPMWLVAIIGTVMVSGGLAVAHSITAVRDSTLILTEKVTVLEAASAERSQVLTQLGSIGAKLDALRADVVRIDEANTQRNRPR
jgi:hypothetical protein